VLRKLALLVENSKKIRKRLIPLTMSVHMVLENGMASQMLETRAGPSGQPGPQIPLELMEAKSASVFQRRASANQFSNGHSPPMQGRSIMLREFCGPIENGMKCEYPSAGLFAWASSASPLRYAISSLKMSSLISGGIVSRSCSVNVTWVTVQRSLLRV
jgi:hypothetical protein